MNRRTLYLLSVVGLISIAAVRTPVSAGPIELRGTTPLLTRIKAWRHTAPDNSLKRRRGPFHLVGRKRGNIMKTSLTDVNIHSHYRKGKSSGWSNYTYTGRMKIADETGGIGVTFYSNYPSADEYYRLRRYSDNSFHIAPHGTEITAGETDTGVTPEPDTWYSFKVMVTTESNKINIKAKVWKTKAQEPLAWQVDCDDSSSTRFTKGRPGVWSMAEGTKWWADLKVIR